MQFEDNISLSTPRLKLRLFQEDDLFDFFQYASVPGVGEMAGWRHHKSLEESKVILQMFISEKNVLSITEKETNKVIGSIGVHAAKFNQGEFSHNRIIEIGYVLSKDYWGRGLVVEALKMVLCYLFKVQNFELVSVGHFKTNIQSKRVIEKSGFIYHSDDVYYAKQLDMYFEESKYIIRPENIECI